MGLFGGVILSCCTSFYFSGPHCLPKVLPRRESTGPLCSQVPDLKWNVTLPQDSAIDAVLSTSLTPSSL